MRKFQTYVCITFTAFAMIISGCYKKERLEEKPNSKLQVPGNLDDLQALLDYHIVFNESPSMGDASADNYYLSKSSWQTLTQKDQHIHLWATDIFMGQGNIPDWNKPYEQVFYANIALQALNKIQRNTNNLPQWNAVQGTALFLRGNAFYELSQLFIPPYDIQSAANDLGLPLRLNDNVLERSVRSSVKQTYDQIISDVSAAQKLLPPAVDTAHPNRPAQSAALALLSKIYLSMRNYDSAGVYADSCLKLHSKLLDYNTISTSTTFPFKINNPEILFYSQSSTNNILMALVSKGTIVDSFLYRSYDVNDLRKTLFFNTNGDSTSFIRSSYTGKAFPFTGLATDETLLIHAECLARAGRKQDALEDLNTLLQNRWKKNTFVPYTDGMVSDPLQLILEERRKELPFRNVRWTDIRRLNKEGMNIILKRKIDDIEYVLLPNNARYTLPIPPDVITLSNMPQNPR